MGRDKEGTGFGVQLRGCKMSIRVGNEEFILEVRGEACVEEVMSEWLSLGEKESELGQGNKIRCDQQIRILPILSYVSYPIHITRYRDREIR